MHSVKFSFLGFFYASKLNTLMCASSFGDYFLSINKKWMKKNCLLEHNQVTCQRAECWCLKSNFVRLKSAFKRESFFDQTETVKMLVYCQILNLSLKF